MVMFHTFCLVFMFCLCSGSKDKRQTDQRVCPTQNICGDGVCQVTSHPSFEYQYICKCNDGTYRFESCPSPRSCSPNPCKNGGICTSTGSCICGSGYSGDTCEVLNTNNLCQNIVCKNGGVCNVVQANMAQCVCSSGFGGYYCELSNAANRCSQISCLNGGTCEERIPGVIPYAFCFCKPGFTGTRCETEYYRCNQNGVFSDRYGCDTSRYFECSNSGTTLNRRDCPPGLRFNPTLTRCDYAKNVNC